MESPQEVKLRYVDYDMPNLNSVLAGLFDQIELISTPYYLPWLEARFLHFSSSVIFNATVWILTSTKELKSIIDLNKFHHLPIIPIVILPKPLLELGEAELIPQNGHKEGIVC